MSFPNNWNHYKEYEQPGTSDGEQTDYQVDITVTHVTGKMRSDFGDVRFTDDEGNELYYHLVSYTESSTALFVVKIPILPINSINLRIYYGNPEATTTSDPENVYQLYDNFNGTSFDSNKWDIIGSTSITVNDGLIITALDNGQNNQGVKSKTNFDNKFKVETTLKRVNKGYHSNAHIGINYHDSFPCLNSICLEDSYKSYLRKDLRGCSGSNSDSSGMTNWSNNIFYNFSIKRIDNTISATKDSSSSSTSNNIATGLSPVAFILDMWDGPRAGNQIVVTVIKVRKTTTNQPATGMWGDEINFIGENFESIHSINILNSLLIEDDLNLNEIENVFRPPDEVINLTDIITSINTTNTETSFIIIDLQIFEDSFFILHEISLREKRRIIESYLKIKNNFIISDERIIEDLIINTDVKSPTDTVSSIDNILVLETAVYQLINVFDEANSIDSPKLLIRLDWRDKREETLTKQWKKDLQLKINLEE